MGDVKCFFHVKSWHIYMYCLLYRTSSCTQISAASADHSVYRTYLPAITYLEQQQQQQRHRRAQQQAQTPWDAKQTQHKKNGGGRDYSWIYSNNTWSSACDKGPRWGGKWGPFARRHLLKDTCLRIYIHGRVPGMWYYTTSVRTSNNLANDKRLETR